MRITICILFLMWLGVVVHSAGAIGMGHYPLTDCDCKTIVVELTGGARLNQGKSAGTYTITFTPWYQWEHRVWVKNGGGRAIWYYPKFRDWIIGPAKDLGERNRNLVSVGDQATACPSDVKNNWMYHAGDNEFKSGGIVIRCASSE
jgi:hypothetical protein